jgi:hypothetical protein
MTAFKEWFHGLFPNSTKTLDEIEREDPDLYLALTRLFAHHIDLR